MNFLKYQLGPVAMILLIAAPLVVPAVYTGDQLAATYLPASEAWYYALSLAFAMVLLPRIIRWMPHLRRGTLVAMWALWLAVVVVVWGGSILAMIAFATGQPMMSAMRAPTSGGALATSVALLFGSLGPGLALAASIVLASPPPPHAPEPQVDVSKGRGKLGGRRRGRLGEGWQVGKLPSSEEKPPQVANLPSDTEEMEELSFDGGGDLTTGELMPPTLDRELGDTVLVYAQEGSYGKAGRRLGLSGEAVRLRVIKARELAPEWVAGVLGD